MDEISIIKKKGKTKFIIKGEAGEVMSSLIDINAIIFDKFIFKEEFNIETRDKFQIIDSYLEELKKELEQRVCLNS